MRLIRDANSIFRVFNPWRQAEWILALLILVSSCFTVSVVPFLRRDFGERYFGWINLFFGYTVIANFAFLGNIIGVAAGNRFSFLMTACWLSFVAMSLYHRWEISRKNRTGQEWHSMSMGTSILPFPFSEEKIFKCIEPALIFLAGVVLWKMTHVVGLWLMISGLSLLVNNHLVYYFQRENILNIRDAQIEAQMMRPAMAGKPAKETAGFVIARSNIELIKKDPGLKSAFSNLPSDLKDMFDAEPDAA